MGTKAKSKRPVATTALKKKVFENRLLAPSHNRLADFSQRYGADRSFVYPMVKIEIYNASLEVTNSGRNSTISEPLRRR
jgi:hypothetical protein